MVYLTCRVLSKHRRFIDSVRIFVRGGRGGNGIPKYCGVGGKGGDVYAEAVQSYSLSQLKRANPSQKFLAGYGDDSRRHCILGMPGKDVTVKSSVGVTILSDTGRVLGDLNKTGDRVLLAQGGCGGGPQNSYLGQKGQVHSVTFDLKLLADVGFVGFPNAGKSTLLKALSKAQPKIASYPFTTIEPKIGILEYDDFRSISMADLPGLIEGAYLNYGMGHKFLKHCLRTKMLLFIIDIAGFRLNPKFPHRTALETILFLNRELELYNPELLLKPAILAINQIDKEGAVAQLKELKQSLLNLKDSVLILPDELRPNQIVKFDAIIPISAKKQKNINELKSKIRAVIDVYHEKKLLERAEKTIDRNNEEAVMFI